MTEPLAIAHVTPHPWGTPHEVNRHIERVCTALAARGHRVVIVAPSDSQELVRATRAAIRKAGREGADDLLPAPGEPPRVLAVGEALPAFTTRTRSTLPIDVSRTIEDLFTVAPLDICHVHEPFAPSTSAAALRHSRALNVGTFHTPTERLLSTQVARKLVALVFGRIDTDPEARRHMMDTTGRRRLLRLACSVVSRRKQPRGEGGAMLARLHRIISSRLSFRAIS